MPCEKSAGRHTSKSNIKEDDWVGLGSVGHVVAVQKMLHEGC